MVIYETLVRIISYTISTTNFLTLINNNFKIKIHLLDTLK